MRIFSRWKAQPVTDRDRADAHLINAAIDIHRDDPEFGYRFISDELPGKGITASLNRVSRLCTQQRLWSVHITERTTGEGKLYLCTVKDACSRRIVGYSIAERMTAQRAVDALSNAVLRRRPVATVVHSDRGSQFRTHAFVHALGTHRLQGSMGTGPRLGRQRGYGVALLAAAEDRPQPPPLATRQQLRLAIISWIENTYHRRRRRKTLGRLTP